MTVGALASPPALDVPTLAALPWPDVELLDVSIVAAVLAETDAAVIGHHPGALLQYARLCAPGQRLTERSAAIDRVLTLEAGRRTNGVPTVFELGALAERAIDEARAVKLDDAEAHALYVLAHPHVADAAALARATEAKGRVLAWRGSAATTKQAEVALLEAADRYCELGSREWRGFVLFWLGNCVSLQTGRIAEAEARIRAGLEVLDPQSPSRAVVLTYLGDILTTWGQWDAAEDALTEALSLAAARNDDVGCAYACWQRARISSHRGDRTGALRNIAEVEHHVGDWFDTSSGVAFLADAAEMLDRVGDISGADSYLERAQARDPHDEFVLQAQAALLARRGDPAEAVRQLQQLSVAPWLEGRQVWRHTLLCAFATLRSGGDGAGRLAALALDQAAELGGVTIAQVGEAELLQTLLPLAQRAGSRVASALMAPAPMLLVHLLGGDTVERGGERLQLPAGKAASLVRLLALSPRGLESDQVLDALWPDVDPEAARKQLRDVLWRLRRAHGEIVLRRGRGFELAAAWIDAEVFRSLADRSLATRGRRGAELAVAALALWAGDPLPAEPYATWTVGPRTQLRRRRLQLLDLIAEEAASRGQGDEALHALMTAIEDDPYDDDRYLRAAQLLVALGRAALARRLLERAAATLREIGVQPQAQLASLLASIR